MKTIQPVSIWTNGEVKQATILNAYAVNVTLGSSATFYYALLAEGQTTLTQGNLIMDGEAYQEWNQDTFAWDWIASELNLVITGDYIPPVPETTTTTLEPTTTSTTTVDPYITTTTTVEE